MEKNCTNCCYYGSCTENSPCEYYIHIEQINTIPHIIEGISRHWNDYTYEQQKDLSLRLDGEDEDDIIQGFVDAKRSDFYTEWFEYINQF